MSAYRDDEAARSDRASSLIDEIAGLERKKVEHAAAERRLEDARRELSDLQTVPAATTPIAVARHPSVVAHLAVFGATASAAYLGYMLLT